VYLPSAIDGYSRLACTEHLGDEKATTSIGILHRARAFFAARAFRRGVSAGNQYALRQERQPHRQAPGVAMANSR